MRNKRFTKKYSEYYTKNYNHTYLNNNYSSKKEINSDFNLILKLLYETIKYIITLPFLILLLIFEIILNKKSQREEHPLYKIISEPLKLGKIISEWIFEAPHTTLLLILNIICYIIEIIYIIPNNLLLGVINHPNYMTTKTYTLITAIFLHANPLHLGMNLLALLIFGRIVEKHLKWKILPIFLLSGIISNIISNIISLQTGKIFYSLGASGAIASLIMFAILLHPFQLTSITIIPIPICILGWALIYIDINNLTTNTQTNHFAHLGGYLAILLIIFFLEWKERKKIIKGFIINILLLIITYFLSKNIDLRRFIIKT